MVDQSGQLLPTSVLAELMTDYPELPTYDAHEFEQLLISTHHRQHPLGERVLARAHDMQTLVWSYAKDLQQHATIVIDCAGGAACAYEKQFLMSLSSQLPLTFLLINTHVDAFFTEHGTDTTDPKNYHQL